MTDSFSFKWKMPKAFGSDPAENKGNKRGTWLKDQEDGLQLEIAELLCQWIEASFHDEIEREKPFGNLSHISIS